MHCVTVRVYLLYYALLSLSLSSLFLLPNYIQRKRFSPGWFPAIIYHLSAAPSLHISHVCSPLCTPVIRPGIYVNAIPTSRVPMTSAVREGIFEQS